ncbi:MAG: hypothetical protein ACRDRJ_03660 [Streptosporangiaceae bacterium]
MDTDAISVIERAESIIYRASWRLLEETALDRLTGTRGLCWAPLEPKTDVIQLVTYDGEHLGHIRRDRTQGQAESWVAVGRLAGRAVGRYASAQEGAEALARACGR